MGSPSPQATVDMFFDRFNAGDAVGFARLYSHDAVFAYDGQDTAVGRDQIERAISGFMAAGFKMRGRNVNTYVVGDVALTRFAWELYDAQDATVASGVSTEVQQRGPDGLWQMIIDDTNGGSRTP